MRKINRKKGHVLFKSFNNNLEDLVTAFKSHNGEPFLFPNGWLN